MAGHEVTAGVIAISGPEGQSLVWGKDWDPDHPVELASLSKAITAACVLALAKAGRLALDRSAASYLGLAPADPAPLSQLLTHSAGLGPDSTQSYLSLAVALLDQDRGRLAEFALTRETQSGTAGQYSYNNENYAVLGRVIEAATDDPYQTVCARRLFEDRALQATRSRRTGAALPWGGWSMSVQDYGRFFNDVFGPLGRVGQAPFDHPHVALDGGAFVGPSVIFRPYNEGFNFWHFGSWCMPVVLEAGSFAVRWENGWSVVVAYDTCLTPSAGIALDRALSLSAYGVKP